MAQQDDEIIDLDRPMDSGEKDLVGGMAMMEMEVEVDGDGHVKVAVDGEVHEADEDVDWEDDDSNEGDDVWRLGIAEEPEIPEVLQPEFFPSKVGGAPAWLDRRDLPSAEDLRCTANNHGDPCGRQYAFICQVYAPSEDDNPDAFHRTTFVFACRNPLCCGKPGSVKAFRSQLPRRNDFYPYEAPDYPEAGPKVVEVVDEPAKAGDMMEDKAVVEALEARKCANESFSAGRLDEAEAGYTKAAGMLDALPGAWIAGNKVATEYAKIRGNRAECRLKRGDNAGAVEDCDAALQADPTFVKALFRRARANDGLHAAGGGAACGATQAARRDLERVLELDEDNDAARGLLKEVGGRCEETFTFREKEMLIEEEPDAVGDENDPRKLEEAKHIEELLEKYNSEMNKELKEDTDKMLNDDEKRDPRDKVDSVYLKFKIRTGRCARQVLRYMFSADAEPLWVHSDGRLDKPVQACPKCKAERIFEFQITPQMLYYLEPDNKSGEHEMEWGSLYVYSCSASCRVQGYAEEYVHVQGTPAQHKL